MSFKAEMEKWFHPHIVQQLEAEFARLEERIRLLESKVGIQIPGQGPAAVDPQNPQAVNTPTAESSTGSAS